MIEIADTQGAVKSLEAQRLGLIEASKVHDDDRSLLKDLNHGLRTELQGLLGMIELLKSSSSLEQQQKYMGTLEFSTERVISTVDTLISFFDFEEHTARLDVQKFSIDQLLSSISRKLNMRSDTDTFEVLYDTDHTIARVISFPRDVLEKLIFHLVNHIIRACHDCCIVVKTRIEEISNKDPMLVIEVSRRKTGNDREEYTSSYDKKNISLDLEIARRLAKTVQADLEIGEFPGGGTGFRFSTDQIVVDDLVSGYVVPSYLKNLRTLIIDDNPVSREVLQELAHTIGWQADVAASGEAAIHMMKFKSGLHAAYDIVLVDWRMPDADGWETSKRIRSEIAGGNLPIIVMISAHNHEYLSKSNQERNEVLNGFITKPISLSMLLDAVIDATAHQYEPDVTETVPNASVDEIDGFAGKKILVVDDNPINLEVARELLSLHGATVNTATGGYAAIAAIQASGEVLDMVLMDIQMPDLDGITTVSKVRSLGYRNLPIVLMTANTSEAIRRECFKAGAMDVVQKPFLARELIDTLLLQIRKRSIMRSASETLNLSRRVTELANELGLDINASLKSLDGNVDSYINVLDSFLLEAERIKGHFGEQAQTSITDDLRRELQMVGGMLGLLGDSKTAQQIDKLVKVLDFATPGEELSQAAKNALQEFGPRFDEAVKAIHLMRSYVLTEATSKPY
ncbi:MULTISPECIES: response regulator [Thalassospira]|uniref:histidine kinase n=2 Tax=Thalassospira TaxID=168934 RepID=A0A367W085_9PROT|nr:MULTISPECIES: hybrid sensor histidine kinase/response regulator [Thalassospira]MDG4717874.1 response regulator [Thalassospira sp. FZY0004]RCK32386.1 hypothetical protein TH19_19040 [Thalassospira profundimaris]